MTQSLSYLLEIPLVHYHAIYFSAIVRRLVSCATTRHPRRRSASGPGGSLIVCFGAGRTQCTIYLSDEDADEEDEAQHDEKIGWTNIMETNCRCSEEGRVCLLPFSCVCL